MVQISAYNTPNAAVSSRKINKKPLREFTLGYVKKLYDKGYYAVKDHYTLDNSRLVLNRSRGAESNFFVFMDIGYNSVNVFFTNPVEDKTGSHLKRKDLIFHKSFKTKEGITQLLDTTLTFASYKPIDSYRCFLHSHLGSINGESLWGDGITTDKNWLSQAMLWNSDFHALTEHNWTQNEVRLDFLNRHCAGANIVLIPGWENTTTVTDTVRSPHILVYCADIDTAMRAKREFLSKKLDKSGLITPVLCGVPVPYDEHIDYLVRLREEGKIAFIVAHPASTHPGIDILDPMNVKALGEKKIWKLLFDLADGVEQYNFADGHNELDYTDPGNKHSKLKKFAKKLKEMMQNQGLTPILSPTMLNYVIGLIAKTKGKITIASQDDHFQPPASYNSISDYAMGHTKFVVDKSTFKRLQTQQRKPTSEEFVKSMITKRFPLTEKPVKFIPVAFGSRENGLVHFSKERMPGRIQNITNWIRIKPAYYYRLSKTQIAYWFSKILPDSWIRNKRFSEIAKELEKARSYGARDL